MKSQLSRIADMRAINIKATIVTLLKLGLILSLPFVFIAHNSRIHIISIAHGSLNCRNTHLIRGSCLRAHFAAASDVLNGP